MDSITLQLPIPALVLRPSNTIGSRGGRFVKRTAIKEARALAVIEALRALDGLPAPLWAKARYYAVCFSPKLCRQDPDNFNASLKPYLDGIADAKIVKNDRNLWPERPEYRLADRFPRVEITIIHE